MKEKERHYFVDETGDLTIFNKRGKNIIGDEGCSKYFILGTALISDPHSVRKQIELLKDKIINDDYLKSIPSVLKKTEKAFHAKDDCAEVRMEIFKLFKGFDVKIYAIVRRKDFICEWVKKQNQYDIDWRYSGDKLYDACVKRLFKDRLHLSEKAYVTFARRGKSARNKTLKAELEKAQQNFQKTYKKETVTDITVSSNYPSHDSCLQVIDYYLWALQRLYERHDQRYFDFVKDKFRRIIDVDDKRFKEYGVYYDERNFLTADKIKDSLKG
ncbi:MAG: DUF3800 domain-containing protein [bacterium]|nr:DUF3800 domain-containing protein [bacterium]MBU1918244.1 DUF3800 domain-containing protein [bacterium]